MAAVDPLNIAPFFSAADILTPKKDEKKSAKRTHEHTFTEQLKKASQSENDAAAVNGFNRDGLAEEIDGKSFDDALRSLVDAVYTAGDALKKNPYTEDFLTYKTALSHFIRFVVQNSYDIELHERRKGKKKQIVMNVQVINKKLDDLAADILYNQADQLKILAKIDESNGIVVNLLS